MSPEGARRAGKLVGTRLGAYQHSLKCAQGQARKMHRIDFKSFQRDNEVLQRGGRGVSCPRRGDGTERAIWPNQGSMRALRDGLVWAGKLRGSLPSKERDEMVVYSNNQHGTSNDRLVWASDLGRTGHPPAEGKGGPTTSNYASDTRRYDPRIKSDPVRPERFPTS